MNFKEYEAKQTALYAEFAEIVQFVIEKALQHEQDAVPRPQSLQCRAKSADSLKKKLEARGLADSDAIETLIKDLAGVRLIFYTNTDADRLLNARIIQQNFDIDWNETKIHHPTVENDQQRYQAIHYTVRLKPERLSLPEYAKFEGLRCEIQIQTILNHAWAETSHDILYKPDESGGFGDKARLSIEKRLKRIMDDHLLPAGYEFQKVQHDFERLRQGKELFDRGAIEALSTAKGNNERHEILSTLKEHVIPNYDDIQAVYPELKDALLRSVRAARDAKNELIETPFGSFPGKTSQDIANLVIEIFEYIRYADIERTFEALVEIYRDDRDEDVRKHVSTAIEHLSDFNIDVWTKAGPYIQSVLIDKVATIPASERAAIMPLVITVCRNCLDSGITGTSWAADSVTFRTGALPATSEVRALRDKALNLLFELFEESADDTDRRVVYSALWEATRLPTQANYSNDLCAFVLNDAKRIIEKLADLSHQMSFEMLEHVEHQVLYEFRRVRHIANDEKDRFGCKAIAEELLKSIQSFHDKVNQDQTFVRYKTLVGFESVFPPHWEDEDFEIEKIDAFRQERVEEFIAAIAPGNEDEWYNLIERCASTKSNDLATFPTFGSFINRLSKIKPESAGRFLNRANDDVLNFLPAFLNGLFESGAVDIYETARDRFFKTDGHLVSLARHWRTVRPSNSEFIQAVLNKAIAVEDVIAVIECLVLAIETHGGPAQPSIDEFFVPALLFLIARNDARWINGVWFLKEAKAFFLGLSMQHVELVLNSMRGLSRIEHHAERILTLIATAHPTLVWQLLVDRIADKRNEEHEERFDALPYQLHGLEKPLSLDAAAAVDIVRRRYVPGDSHFRFDGGRLLYVVFPTLSPEFAQQLIELVTTGEEANIRFVLGILPNYEGAVAIHPVLREVVKQLPEGDERLGQVELCIESTGVVSGEFGRVEAIRERKSQIATWLTDGDSKVRSFAEQFLPKLDRDIAVEQRRAEQDRELRKRDFDSDEDPDS